MHGAPCAVNVATVSSGYRANVKRDVRHVLIFMAVVMPIALVATLFTSSPVLHRVQGAKRSPLAAVATLIKADARADGEAIDVSLDRRIRLLRPSAE
jgi:hypothetical protein